MIDTIITYVQVFAIGFGFGIIGPCFLVCTPILITYITGTRKEPAATVNDVAIFLSGRLSAYVLLGFLTGLSTELLTRFLNSSITAFFRPAGGIISVLMGLMILVYKDGIDARCAMPRRNKYGIGGLFTLGFIVGIAPCPPLFALIFEVALISRNVLDAVAYVTFFGLGTFLSGLVVVGVLGGVLAWIPAWALRSDKANLVFRIICAILLILLGIGIISGHYSLTGNIALKS